MIASVIDRAIVIESLEGPSKEDVIDEMLRGAVEAGALKPTVRAPVRKLLLAREEQGSTGIGNGFAVPHAKTKHREEALLIVARSNAGIPYAAIDGRDVHFVFMLLGPENAAEDHLQMLRWISSLARNADFRRFMRGAADAGAIRELLHDMRAP